MFFSHVADALKCSNRSMKVTCQDFLYMVIFIKLRLVNRIFELANVRDVNL